MLSKQIASALDRPIWSALTTGHRRFAEGGPRALRYPPDVAPFAAMPEDTPEGFRALGQLFPPGGLFAQFTLEVLTIPPGFKVEREEAMLQMVAPDAPPSAAHDLEPVALGQADVPEMLDLVRRTQPGPFAPRTYELGRYMGVRADGVLAAMAGERMRLDGAVEISAVCVDPEYRGSGYAAFLVTWLVRKLREEGLTPFLHVLTANVSAIALYERLRFTTRQTLRLTVLARTSGA